MNREKQEEVITEEVDIEKVKKKTRNAKGPEKDGIIIELIIMGNRTRGCNL